ncbi:uncharacterized protein LOC132788831 isoform X1 [Drosophila nasuta]|nr:uncharacterized protein LOC132788831 isoform X1 [Drosophila nasuta]
MLSVSQIVEAFSTAWKLDTSRCVFVFLRMSLLLIFILVTTLSALAYIGYVLHKKGINPKEIRVNSIQGAKQLLTLPSNAGPQRYLAKNA